MKNYNTQEYRLAIKNINQPGKLQVKSDPLRLIQIPCISDKMFQSLKDSIVRFEKIINFYKKK